MFDLTQDGEMRFTERHINVKFVKSHQIQIEMFSCGLNTGPKLSDHSVSYITMIIMFISQLWETSRYLWLVYFTFNGSGLITTTCSLTAKCCKTLSYLVSHCIHDHPVTEPALTVVCGFRQARRKGRRQRHKGRLCRACRSRWMQERVN